MAFRLGAFADVGLDEALLKLVLTEHTTRAKPRLDKLWAYYRNPLQPIGPADPPPDSPLAAALAGLAARSRTGNWYRLAQEIGLPPRVTGLGSSEPGLDDRNRPRREVVIENDIAWRIHAMIDFLFGQNIKLRSHAAQPADRARIEAALQRVWEDSGGIGLLHDAALLGHVFGHVDLLVRAPAGDELRPVTIETIEPRRGTALADPADYRRLRAYILHYTRELNAVETAGAAWLGRALHRNQTRRRRAAITEIFSPAHHQIYEDDRLVAQANLAWTGGLLPVAHIQNVSQPFAYEGLSEVEPLIPLQDELNTRLSDRATRVTMQSFRMYLAKGVEGLDQTPIGPGQVWITDNPDASITPFGGDGAAPGEDAHIAEIRAALDKLSGVPPLASGVVQAKVGNLSSANALKITLMGVLSKTARKRVTYGRGILHACELVLRALDFRGVLATRPEDRGLSIDWPEVLPEDARDTLAAAEAKLRVGVPEARVLDELGYTDQPGVR